MLVAFVASVVIMEESFDIWRLLAGLGIFLFGMFLLEESIKQLAGRSFKRFIRERTNGRLKSITSGALVTAVLQSSSAVSLIVLAFVGAGIMVMENAIGVIIGSNIGTTATAWIVAFVGFKLKIEAFALPLIGIGGLILIFLGKSQRYSNISKLLVGFGFLFMGLDFMKESVMLFADQFDLTALQGYGVIVFAIIGMLATAVMQSSSAVIAIVLTGLHAGIIGFEAAAAMVVGANVGTTATVLLGGLGATQMKKRVAISHLVFNLTTGVLGMVLLYPLVWMVQAIVGTNPENAVMGVALFHTIFNVMGAILFFPFIALLTKMLYRIIPDKAINLTRYLHKITAQVPEAAVAAVRKEVVHLIMEAFRYNVAVLNMKDSSWFKNEEELKANHRATLEVRYENLKRLQAEIFTFSTRVQTQEIDAADSDNLNQYLHAARMAAHSAKSMKDIKHNIDDFESEDNEFIYGLCEAFRERQRKHMNVLNLLVEEKHEEIAGEIARTLIHIGEEDKEFVLNVHKQVAAGKISDMQVSDLLMVNRTFNQSWRQMLTGMREVMLTEQEIALFDRLTDTDLRTIRDKK